MNIGIYYSRAGVIEGNGKPIYVRRMIAELADEHDITLYTGGGTLLEEVRRFPADVVQLPFDRTAERLEKLTRGTLLSHSMRSSLGMYLTARRRGVFERMARHDVLWTHYWLDDLLVSRSVSVPTVYHCHGYSDRPVPFTDRRVAPGERLRKRFSDASLYLAVSESLAERVRGDAGIDPDGVVTPGVDLDVFSPDADPAFESDVSTVVFVGRLVRDKGVYDLLDAYETLCEDGTAADLYFIGPGEAETLRRDAGARGLDGSVHLLGPVPHADLSGYYAAADVVCYPSYHEGLPLVGMEAMACGRPLVTTRIPAIEEYITDGENGLLVRPGDSEALAAAIERVLDSPALGTRLGRAGREAASAYSWTQQAAAFVELVDDHLAGDRRVAGGRR